jgi:formylglycine-generating enzyme required for sulfatase activity
LTEPAGLEFVAVEAGAFLMGSRHPGRDDETPLHRVDLGRFEIARTAVTNRQYRVFLAASGAPLPGAWGLPGFDDPDQPVVAVSWFEAAAFCEWLTARTGRGHRLPTEAERERACRAGSDGPYPWGADARRDLGAYGRRWAAGPELVGGPPNALCLCNMADNVHEWCLDWYGADYYRASPERDPRGPEHGVRRASRGGSWRHQVKVTRSAARSSLPPERRYTDYGFRVVRAAD